MIALWPCGVPIFMAVVFWRQRKTLSELTDEAKQLDARAALASSTTDMLKSLADFKVKEETMIAKKAWLKKHTASYEYGCAWFDVAQ